MSNIYGISQADVQRMIKRLKAGREAGGGALVVDYAWRDSAYGGRYAVPLYGWGTGQDLKLSVWMHEQRQLENIPALAVVAKRVKSAKFKASPWDGLLRPILEAC
jgi:hypothetical protein